MKIAVVADTHLGKILAAGYPELYTDSFDAFMQMAQYMVEHRADLDAIILAGDITDASRIDGTIINVMHGFLDLMKEVNLPVYYVQGNHDIQSAAKYPATPLLAHAGSVHLHQNPRKLGGTVVNGLDYDTPEGLRRSLAELPPCDLLVLHTKFLEFLTFEAADALSLEDISAAIKCIAVGDIHIPRTVRNEATGQILCSPGALHAVKINEYGPYGIAVLTFDDSGKCTAEEHVEIFRRRIIPVTLRDMTDPAELDIIVQATVDAVKATISETGKRPLIGLKYNSSQYQDSIAFENAVKASCGQDTMIAHNSVSDRAELVKLATTEGLRGPSEDFTLSKALPLAISAEKEPRVYRLLEQLLLADSALSAESIIEEFCNTR